MVCNAGRRREAHRFVFDFASRALMTRLLTWCQEALERRPPLVGEDGTLRIHTLFSRRRPIRSLYPLAHVHATETSESNEKDDGAVPTWQEHVVVLAAWSPPGEALRLAYALELYVYTLPRERSAVVYVSKLDSSGYGPQAPCAHVRKYVKDTAAVTTDPATSALGATMPLSLTAALTIAVLTYFASREHWPDLVDHVSLHVLARAQHAYLFPSSEQHPGKRVLSDAALIRWWHTCLSEVVLFARHQLATRVDPFYVIPGYERLDSHAIVPLARPEQVHISARAHWHYGYPYSARGAGVADVEQVPPLPLHACTWEHRYKPPRDRPAALAARVIPTLIPVFPDDPKGRFLHEQASTAHAPGVSCPQAIMQCKPAPTPAQRDAMHERYVLERLSVDGFWQRMGYRQECCSGNAVGIFVVGITTTCRDHHLQLTHPCTPPTDVVAPPAQACALPHPMLDDIVLKYMMQDTCTWNVPADAAHCTRRLYDAVDRALRRKGCQSMPCVEIPLHTVPEDVKARAHDACSGHEANASATRQRDSSPPVRVLSVKKKRPRRE